jgi:hypothetical protein
MNDLIPIVILVLELRSQLIAKDSPQPFSGNPQGFDAVFFSGANNKTGEYLIIATERRPQNITYGIFYLLVIVFHSFLL